MIKVAIIESERGWGQRIDEVHEFPTREAAEAIVKNNKDNNLLVVPDWYMKAEIVES